MVDTLQTIFVMEILEWEFDTLIKISIKFIHEGSVHKKSCHILVVT